MNKPRILVVDDDKDIVKVMRSYLEQAGFLVLSANTGETALHLLRSEKPDLLVLDLMLPDRDGWDITRLVRADATLGALPILMLTARVEDTDKILGLELGADDYVTKPFNARETVARVRALLRRAQFGHSVVPQLLRVGTLVLDLDQHALTIDGKAVDLTRTEFTLLQLLMMNLGHTFTRDELLEKSMGYAYEGMGRTLDTHISNLRKKIEADPSNPTYIRPSMASAIGWPGRADEPALGASQPGDQRHDIGLHPDPTGNLFVLCAHPRPADQHCSTAGGAGHRATRARPLA